MKIPPVTLAEFNDCKNAIRDLYFANKDKLSEAQDDALLYAWACWSPVHKFQRLQSEKIVEEISSIFDSVDSRNAVELIKTFNQRSG